MFFSVIDFIFSASM